MRLGGLQNRLVALSLVFTSCAADVYEVDEDPLSATSSKGDGVRTPFAEWVDFSDRAEGEIERIADSVLLVASLPSSGSSHLLERCEKGHRAARPFSVSASYSTGVAVSSDLVVGSGHSVKSYTHCGHTRLLPKWRYATSDQFEEANHPYMIDKAPAIFCKDLLLRLHKTKRDTSEEIEDYPDVAVFSAAAPDPDNPEGRDPDLSPLPLAKAGRGYEGEVLLLGHPWSDPLQFTRGRLTLGEGKNGFHTDVTSTDLTVFPGVSGGPLITSAGELLGQVFAVAVNEETHCPDKLTHISPIDHVREVIEAWKDGARFEWTMIRDNMQDPTDEPVIVDLRDRISSGRIHAVHLELCIPGYKEVGLRIQQTGNAVNPRSLPYDGFLESTSNRDWCDGYVFSQTLIDTQGPFIGRQWQIELDPNESESTNPKISYVIVGAVISAVDVE